MTSHSTDTAAPCTSRDSMEPPEFWRATAVLQALHSPARSYLGQSCRAAFQCLVEDWPEATLTVSIRASSAETADALSRRLKSAQQQLSLRRGKPTGLVIQQRGEVAKNDCWWQLQYAPPGLLTGIAAAFPNVTALVVGSVDDEGCDVELPKPAAMPALRHLTVRKVSAKCQKTFFKSAAPYLPQLLSLVIKDQPDGADYGLNAFEPAFTHPVPSTTLKRLSVHCALETDLVQSILRHAPSVEELTVTSTDVDGDHKPFPATVLALKTLRLSYRDMFHTSVLEWLPLPAEGRLAVELSGKGSVEVVVSLEESVEERLSRLDLRGCDKVQVFTMWGQSTGAALRAALPSLAQLHKPGTTELVLHNTRMDEDLAQGIADAAAAGWQVSLTKVRWSDDALARPLPPLRTVALANGGRPSKELMRSLSTVAELSVQEMCFVSRWVPEGCVVPWRNTRISRWEAILHEFVNEATALDGQTSWDLQSMLLQLSPEEVTSGDYIRMAEALRRVNLTSVGDMKISLEKIKPDDKPSVLRASIEIVRAMPCKPDWLSIKGFAGTEALVNELASLPPWTHLALHMCSNTKTRTPPHQSPMVRTLSTVPSTYEHVRVWAVSTPLTEVEAVIQGALKQLRPLTIEMVGVGDKEAASMKRKYDVPPHVKVQRWE